MVLLYPNGRPRERTITRPTIERLKASTISVIPDAMYPWDPTVVHWIRREFDPDFIPVFVKNIWKTSTGERVEYHHAAAASSRLEELTQEIHPMTYRSLQPTYGKLHRLRPTRIHLHFYHRDLKTKRRRRGILGFVPFDWDVFYSLVSMRTEMTAQEQKEFLEKHDEAKAVAKATAAVDEEKAKTEKEDDNWLGREVAKFDAKDWRRIQEKGLGYNPNPATKPSVYVRRPA